MEPTINSEQLERIRPAEESSSSSSSEEESSEEPSSEEEEEEEMGWLRSRELPQRMIEPTMMPEEEGIAFMTRESRAEALRDRVKDIGKLLQDVSKECHLLLEYVDVTLRLEEIERALPRVDELIDLFGEPLSEEDFYNEIRGISRSLPVDWNGKPITENQLEDWIHEQQIWLEAILHRCQRLKTLLTRAQRRYRERTYAPLGKGFQRAQSHFYGQ